jgi:membrane protein
VIKKNIEKLIEKSKELGENALKKSRFLRMIWGTFYGFYKDDGFTFSAGISFYFLLSFIPFLILVGAAAGFVIGYLQGIYELTNEEMAALIKNYINLAIPFISEKYISGFLKISDYRTSLTTIGLISAAVSSTLLFSTLQYCFFRIFGGKSLNVILSRLLGLVFLVTIVTFLFFFHYMTTIFASVINSVSVQMPSVSWIFNLFTQGWIYSFLLSTLVIVVLFEVLIFYFTFKAGISKRAIIIGALTFSVLWNGAKLLYNFYITELSTFSIFYGSATWIITSILWVYYSAVILIICMELTKSLTEHYFKLEK